MLVGLFKYFGVTVNSGRLVYLADVHPAMKAFVFHIHYAVWSILGLGWLVALRYLDLGRPTIPFFVTLFCLMLLLPVSGDQTRILAIITFPLIAEYWLFNVTFLTQLTKRELAAIFVAWVLMPWAWTWSGIPKWSVFPYNIAYVPPYAFWLVRRTAKSVGVAVSMRLNFPLLIRRRDVDLFGRVPAETNAARPGADSARRRTSPIP